MEKNKRKYPSKRKKRVPFSQEEVDFVRKHNHHSRKEIARLIGSELGIERDVHAVKGLCRKYGIKSQNKKRSPPNKGTTKFTDEQLKFLAETRPNNGLDETTKLFNEKFNTTYKASSIRSICQRFNYQKKYKSFPPDYSPWNKGVKNEEYKWGMKPGTITKNSFPVGSEIIMDGYIYIKIAHGKDKKNYMAKHRYLWEKRNGKKIPRGMAVVFRDGDKLNFDPENLILVTRRELAHLTQNGFYSAPEEIKETLLLISSLQSKTSEELIKKNGGEPGMERGSSVLLFLHFEESQNHSPVSIQEISQKIWPYNSDTGDATKEMKKLSDKNLVEILPGRFYQLTVLGRSEASKISRELQSKKE